MNMTTDYAAVYKKEGLNQTLRDYEVCKAVLNGNTQAFAVLAAQYQKRIYMLGLSFFDNTDDCEDFVQDVMLKAYSAFGTFRAEASFATCLMRSTRLKNDGAMPHLQMVLKLSIGGIIPKKNI